MESGLTYMKARIYDPVVGRFLSGDPIAFTGSPFTFNRYAYGNDNPYRYTDPTGMCTGSNISNDDGSCKGGGFTEDAKGDAQLARYNQYKADFSQDHTSAFTGASMQVAQIEPEPSEETRVEETMRETLKPMSTEEEIKEQEKYNEQQKAQARSTRSWLASRAGIPQKAINVLDFVEQYGKAPQGYTGGRIFQNREGILPAGGPYHEYDVDPTPARGSGLTRNAERIIYEPATGRAWYTSDHYASFTEFPTSAVP
jgi:RHS repeat-associated protein